MNAAPNATAAPASGPSKREERLAMWVDGGGGKDNGLADTDMHGGGRRLEEEWLLRLWREGIVATDSRDQIQDWVG